MLSESPRSGFPFGLPRAFGALLAVLFVLSLLISGFWVGALVKVDYVPTVEPGTVVICEATPVVAFTTPGLHFCPSGKWSSFRLHERVDFTSEVRLQDANVVQIRTSLVYTLPSDPDQLASIYQSSHGQVAFNEGVVQGNAVRNLALVFSQIDAGALAPRENLARMGEYISDRTRDDLQRNWNVVLESFWFKVRVYAPSNTENFQPQSYERTI
jgi:hypothetical protein